MNSEKIIAHILNHIYHRILLVTCHGVTDYLVYHYQKMEGRVYNTVFKIEDVKQIILDSSGDIEIVLKNNPHEE